MSSVFNIDLIGTMLIIMSYMRSKKRYSMSHHLFCGIQFIVPPTDSELERVKDPPKPKRAKATPRPKSVYEKLELLNIQMLRLNASYIMGEASVITGQIFWHPFDRMVSAGLCAIILLLWAECYNCFKGMNTERFWLPVMALGAMLLSMANSIVVMRYDVSCKPFFWTAMMLGVVVTLVSVMLEAFPVVPFSLFRLLFVHSMDEPPMLTRELLNLNLRNFPSEVVTGPFFVIIWYCVFAGIISVSLVPSGLRFSHSLLILTGGTATEKAQTIVRYRLWFEVFLPLLVLSNIWVAPADALLRRLTGVLLLVLVRLANYGALLQCHADRGSSELALGLSIGDAGLLKLPGVLRNRVGSLVSAATELLAPIIMLATASVIVYYLSVSRPEATTGLAYWVNDQLGRETAASPLSVPKVECVPLSELLRSPLSLSLLKKVLVCLKAANMHSSVSAYLCSLAYFAITTYCLLWPMVVFVCILFWRFHPYEFRLSSF